eukprot:Pgem_evm1s2457
MSHPDFMNGKSEIEILVEKHNQLAIFLPKFHCEINPIEKLGGFPNVIAVQTVTIILKAW